jgi:hypothetical protein
MGMGIGGGLPRAAYRYEAVPHYKNRRTFFTVESHIEADTTPGGRKRTFSTRAAAENRADALNREAATARSNTQVQP